MKAGIELKKVYNQGNLSDINKQGFIRPFHMLGGFNPVYEEPNNIYCNSPTWAFQSHCLTTNVDLRIVCKVI